MDEGPSAGDRAIDVASKLLEHLDLAASFVLDSVQDRLLEPLEDVRRVLLLGIVLLMFLGVGSIVLGYVNLELFQVIFPYLFGAMLLAGAAGLHAIDRQAKELKQRIRELSSRAEKWRKVASWARDRLD